MQRETDTHTGDQYQDHMDRLDDIRREFAAGRLNFADKRGQIVNENNAYYRAETKSPVTGQSLTSMPFAHDPAAAIIAESTGAPVQAVRSALNQWRQANHDSANAEHADDARQLFADGRAAFYQVLKAAIPRRT